MENEVYFVCRNHETHPNLWLIVWMCDLELLKSTLHINGAGNRHKMEQLQGTESGFKVSNNFYLFDLQNVSFFKIGSIEFNFFLPKSSCPADHCTCLKMQDKGSLGEPWRWNGGNLTLGTLADYHVIVQHDIIEIPSWHLIFSKILIRGTS